MGEFTANPPNPLQTADGIVALTPALSVMSANHVVRWLIGSDPKPGKPFPLQKLFSEPELTRVRASINNSLETGQPLSGYGHDLLCDAGIKLSCNYSVQPLFAHGKTIIGVILSFQSVPDILSFRSEKTSRYTLRRTFPDAETLIEKLPEAVFTITPHWQISSFNQMAEKLTGFNRQEAIGKYCWEVFHSDSCKLSCPLRIALDGGQTALDQTARILDKNKVRKAILVNTNVLRDISGVVLGAVATFRPLIGDIQPPGGLSDHDAFADIVGGCESMQRLFSMIPDVAACQANVLLCGESGTGKDLFARAIHNHSPRSKGPFIAANCSAFAETLLESEMFGYEKAAFTGADRTKSGRFELAKGGTLFLDEIGDLKPALQVKLLRVIEQREFERVGGTKSIPMDARVISATNKNLIKSIESGAFREDLYYRLRTVPLLIPPLRERREDIPLLVTHFIRRFNEKYNKNVRSVDLKVMRFFEKYHFPGNVRELERALEHAFVFVKGPVIFMGNLPDLETYSLSTPLPATASARPVNTKSKEALLWALSQSGGKKAHAAQLLRMSRTSLWRRVKQFDLE